MRIRIFISTILLLQLIFTGVLHSQEYNYCVAVLPTPVLNTSDFESVFGGRSGTQVKLDGKGLIREMELIALPGTVFTIDAFISKGDYNILEVRTNDYPYESSKLYIDSRFIKFYEKRPADREQKLPSRHEILKALNDMEGYSYMWGGNFADGIPQLVEYYRPQDKIDNYTQSLWKLEGVDCSGLIYQASNGCLPRNTSSMTTFGEGLSIAGKNANQIAAMVEPLDLIVWAGHVVIVLDENTVIESSPGSGVKKTNLVSRLRSVLNERKAVNDWNSTSGKRFVIRRWYSED